MVHNTSLMLLELDIDYFSCCALTVLPKLEYFVDFLIERWATLYICSMAPAVVSSDFTCPLFFSAFCLYWWRGVKYQRSYKSDKEEFRVPPVKPQTNYKYLLLHVLYIPLCLLMCSRCFSFGIGEGASSALINGLAREGGGHAQFITGTERMQPKVRQS